MTHREIGDAADWKPMTVSHLLNGVKALSLATLTAWAIAASCVDVQATWDANERHRRNVLPAERWELAEASAAAVSSERSDYCGLLR